MAKSQSNMTQVFPHEWYMLRGAFLDNASSSLELLRRQLHCHNLKNFDGDEVYYLDHPGTAILPIIWSIKHAIELTYKCFLLKMNTPMEEVYGHNIKSHYVKVSSLLKELHDDSHKIRNRSLREDGKEFKYLKDLQVIAEKYFQGSVFGLLIADDEFFDSQNEFFRYLEARGKNEYVNIVNSKKISIKLVDEISDDVRDLVMKFAVLNARMGTMHAVKKGILEGDSKPTEDYCATTQRPKA